MKNKKLTYLLIVAVIFIWGAIIYKIFDVVNPDDDLPLINPTVAGVKPTVDDYEVLPDTTQLLLNYPDPFGQVRYRDTAATPVKRVSHSIVRQMPTVPAINWGGIKYSGYVINGDQKKNTAFIKINGNSLTLMEGETADQVKLLKNMKDSIKVMFQGQVKVIKISYN
ncbi:hypothetical protein IDJ77_08320 [Mucilaginibacter sp. ZT4R22]|uniref:Uncharacterized protein n=1 Tax=Mucilaginibacter pankratovii TaxID=2772110 RepID=A0ABR7WR40_9SPHI|nr:hypothetical protein [Mucilaginibacter pankratovii]MBD1363814.1 hypothetical protein [Mucilaginibacter pankratovii]